MQKSNHIGAESEKLLLLVVLLWTLVDVSNEVDYNFLIFFNTFYAFWILISDQEEPLIEPNT